MVKQHPAIKSGRRILKAAGIGTMPDGALSLRVLCKEYNGRPLRVDIVPDTWADNTARFSVSWLDSAHSEYPRAAVFNGVEFNF